jgi:hypothetical protein
MPIPIQRFASALYKNLSQEGLAGFVTTAKDIKLEVQKPVVHEINKRRGTNIYDRKWDVLVLLDCARIDMVEAIQQKYEFLATVNNHYTPGTSSAEWMETTFTEKYREQMAETVHVTANPNSAHHLSEDDFLHLEEVWKDGWDPELETISAREVTDRAIALYRKLTPNRMIVHYMQPHPPFIPRSDIKAVSVKKPGMEKEKMNVEELHTKGGMTSNQLWDAHMENLEYVMEDVELLRSSIQANKFVISADHGQAFGEGGVWGHPRSTNADVVRYVPWCETTAENSSNYNSGSDFQKDRSDSAASIEEKLEYLGYK